MSRFDLPLCLIRHLWLRLPRMSVLHIKMLYNIHHRTMMKQQPHKGSPFTLAHLCWKQLKCIALAAFLCQTSFPCPLLVRARVFETSLETRHKLLCLRITAQSTAEHLKEDGLTETTARAVALDYFHRQLVCTVCIKYFSTFWKMWEKIVLQCFVLSTNYGDSVYCHSSKWSTGFKLKILDLEDF